MSGDLLEVTRHLGVLAGPRAPSFSGDGMAYTSVFHRCVMSDCNLRMFGFRDLNGRFEQCLYFLIICRGVLYID